MPQDVVKRVHDLARRSYASRNLVFQFRDGGPVDDDDESAADDDYDPNNDSDGDNSDGDDNNDNDGNDSDGDDDDPDEGNLSDDQSNRDANADAIEDAEDDASEPGAKDGENDKRAGVAGTHDGITGVENDDDIDDDDDDDGTMDGNADAEQDGMVDRAQVDPTKHQYNLRPKKPRSYKHLHPELEDVMMTQLNLKKGLETFGEAGAEAVSSELQQLHD
jgi:hypothetical protein